MTTAIDGTGFVVEVPDGWRLHNVQAFAQSQEAYDALDWPEWRTWIEPDERWPAGHWHVVKRKRIGDNAGEFVCYPPTGSGRA